MSFVDGIFIIGLLGCIAGATFMAGLKLIDIKYLLIDILAELRKRNEKP